MQIKKLAFSPSWILWDKQKQSSNVTLTHKTIKLIKLNNINSPNLLMHRGSFLPRLKVTHQN